MSIRILTLFFFWVFLTNSAFAQKRDTIFDVIKDNDVAEFRLIASQFKTDLEKEANIDDLPLWKAIKLFDFLILPAELDRPLLCQIVVDSLGPIMEPYWENRASEEVLMNYAALGGAKGVLRYFFEQGHAFDSSIVEQIILCDLVEPDDERVLKEEQNYLDALAMVLEAQAPFDTSFLRIDFYFKESKCKRKEIPELLLRYGAKGSPEAMKRLEEMQSSEFTIVQAIIENDRATFQALLKEDVNVYASYRDTLLLEYALFYDRPDMLIELIELGADMETPNPRDSLPVYFSLSIHHSIDLFELVLTTIENINQQYKGQHLLYQLTEEYEDSKSYSSERYAGSTKEKKHFKKVFQLLTDFGADFNLLVGSYNQHTVFELIAWDISENPADVEIYTLFLSKTNSLDSIGDETIERMLRSNHDPLIEKTLDRLTSYVVLFATNRSYETNVGLDYLFEHHLKKLDEPAIEQLVLHLSRTAPNAQLLKKLLNALPMEAGQDKEKYLDALLNAQHYTRPYTDQKMNLLFTLFEQLQENYFSEEREVRYGEVIELLLSKGMRLEGKGLSLLIGRFDSFKRWHPILFKHLVGRLEFFESNRLAVLLADEGMINLENLRGYEEDKKREVNSSFCATCKMKGTLSNQLKIPGNVKVIRNGDFDNPLPNRGYVALDYTDKTSCNDAPINLFLVYPNSLLSMNAVYSVRAYNVMEKSVSTFSLRSSTDVSENSMACTTSHTIPACKVDETQVNCLPILRFSNTSTKGQAVVIEQNEKKLNLDIGQTLDLDRTLGPISIQYNGTSKEIEIQIEVDHNITAYDLDAIQQRQGSAFVDRLYFYLIAQAGQAALSNTRSDYAATCLLTEYAFQKGFHKSSKEQLEKAFNELTKERKTVLELFRFQKLWSQSEVHSQQELEEILLEARTEITDPALLEEIDSTLAKLKNDWEQLSTQLTIFSSAYFDGLAQKIEAFKLSLLEYAYYQPDPTKLEHYKNHENIQLILKP